jgi:hypothetical protein
MLRHSIPHSLSDDEARQMLDAAFAHYHARHPGYHPSLSWLNPRQATLGLRIGGYELSGRLSLRPGEVGIEMDVPLLLRPFQGTVKQRINREAARWLERPAED